MSTPERRIRTEEDLKCFLDSRQFAQLWAIMLRLNAAVRGKRVSSLNGTPSPAVTALLKLLDDVNGWVEEIPPADINGRFGNPAFREWHKRLVSSLPSLTRSVVEHADAAAIADSGLGHDGVTTEVAAHLGCAFGDATRIDYGSGHEAAFLVALVCLYRVGALCETDDEHVVLSVFRRYLATTRRLQTTYRLEPAGSHGVWGLDDYAFLPFLWGSAQLVSNARVDPGFVTDEAAIAANRDEFLYVDAIGFIREVKTGTFHEHSPMLFDISNVRGGWKKINSGMIKMYRGEVWSKRVVVQHLLFGKLFAYDGAGNKAAKETEVIAVDG